MEYMDQSNENHTLKLLKTALPYMNSTLKNPAEIIVKSTELTTLFQNLRNPPHPPLSHQSSSVNSDNSLQDTLPRENTLRAASLEPGPDATEQMLSKLRGVATNSEKELIDTYMNMMKMRHFYIAYRNFLKEKQKNSSEDTSNAFSNENLMEFLFSRLSGSDAETFQILQQAMAMQNSVNNDQK
ncbi:MAG: hypothetical protein K6G65_04615 [Lachnospiraceae bacterium]|nr:hypothetical protein [Lachnospiraceae bacterium]